MGTGIALCRHPLTQFAYTSIAESLDMWLLCHETKSQVRSTSGGVSPERISVYENYDVNNLVEYDAARIVESTDCRGIIALSEVDMLRAAQLRSRYGIPGLKSETALLFRDKVLMKERLRAAGIRVPRFTTVDTGLDVRSAAAEFGFPFVVKPRMGGGSVGAQVVRDESGLQELLRAGLRANFYTPAHLEAEEFVAGDLYHVDGLVLDGRVHLHTVSRYGSDILEFSTPVSTRMIGQESAQARRMSEFTTAVLRELGLLVEGVHSYFHCEVFDSPDGLVLCEVAARPGGLGIVDQVDAYFGVNTFELLLAATFGGPVPAPAVTEPGRDLVGWIGVPTACDPGVVKSIIPEASWVGERMLRRSAQAGQQISSVDLDGFVLVRSGSESELDAMMSDAVSRFATAVAR
ncbi:ATP-grasp domain-containing protein [Kitasatospora sp. GP82]|uniref:ATP-grasp domain-containing protein n=1 Tax=Kitasatospora sp. GP82 TaxID=3035089 RepID=UPI002475962B|nr:ATP-grasp domain-containing protein [Kitasatospora sp. GP82]MDH6123910.1 formate-dependent phosphoribosylglycinamide formyltransferase (GAR transformylase) [Kitasatospora sp. GP82]